MFEIEAVYKVKTTSDRVYKLSCPQNSPLTEVEQVLAHMHEAVQKRVEEFLKEKEEVEKAEDHEEKEE